MKLRSCHKHAVAWSPGSWEERPEDQIGDMCPVCASEKFRHKFNELIENTMDVRDEIEESGEPCPLCGCVGSHDEAMKLDGDLVCIFGDLEYWERVKEEWAED